MNNIILYATPINSNGNSEILGPTPERAKLKINQEYLILDIYDDDKSSWESEAYVSLLNDEGEIWFISNRHLNITKVMTGDNKNIIWINKGFLE